MISVWTDTKEMPQFEKLQKDIKTHVLIIGGGMAGILCAYRLSQAGIDYVLAEAGRVCGGTTENTTAKITSQHGLIYGKLLEKYGIEKARMYLDANEKALSEYRRLCEGIDCDFEERDSFVYSPDKPEKIYRELKALDRIGHPAEFSEKLPLPFAAVGAVKFPGQAQFHPLKFAAAIVRGLNIYENTPILALEKLHTKGGLTSGTGVGTRVKAAADKANIYADKVIVATHFPFLNKHGSYFLKMHQSRSYVLALEGAAVLDGMYVDESEKGMSFRSCKDLLLIGGGAHRTGKPGGKWEELEVFRKENYDHTTTKYHWAAQDCMTLDGIPYIGRYSAHTPELYAATGFNKWGMTSAMAAAVILCDRILEKKNEEEAVFSPSRSMLHPQLLVNSAVAAASLLTITEKRCPHMGCALKWNPQERTWDCPCHGSRFTEEGKRIDNPATGDLHIH